MKYEARKYSNNEYNKVQLKVWISNKKEQNEWSNLMCFADVQGRWALEEKGCGAWWDHLIDFTHNEECCEECCEYCCEECRSGLCEAGFS